MTSAQLSQNPFGRGGRERGRLTKEESTKRAFTFSLIAHLGLLAFLVIGISWNNSTPAGIEVELWDSSQQVETPPVPELKTEFKEEAADIAVKKKPVEKEPPKKEVVKEVPKAVTPPPLKEVPKKIEPPKKAEGPKIQMPAETKLNPALEKARNEYLKKLGATAGTESGKNGTVGTGIGKGGSAAPGWSEKINKKILPLITFNNSTISGNPPAIVQVRLAPDGTILKREIITSSGIVGFDQAVLFALDKAQTLPKDDSGRIPDLNPTLTFRPQDK